jgi:hypothetical protein
LSINRAQQSLMPAQANGLQQGSDDVIEHFIHPQAHGRGAQGGFQCGGVKALHGAQCLRLH